jgi:hypothetical protein
MPEAEPDLPEGFEDLPQEQQLAMARDKAKKMLDGLLESKRDAEQRARTEGGSNQPGFLTGRHAMDQAIASTKRMLEALDALCQDMGADDEPPPAK